MYRIPDQRRVACVWYLKKSPYAKAEIIYEEGRGRQEPDGTLQPPYKECLLLGLSCRKVP